MLRFVPFISLNYIFSQAKNTVNIHLCLFRLPQYTTDILVTFNDPVCIK